MLELYIKLVKAGKRTIDSIPEKFRDDVRAAIGGFMNLLAVIDLLCDITTQQSDLLRKLVTELEHTKQVSQEVKSYYREAFENIEKQLDVSEYNCRRIE